MHTLAIVGMTDSLLRYGGNPPNVAPVRENSRRWAEIVNKCSNDFSQESEFTTPQSASDHSWGSSLDGIIVDRYLDCIGENVLIIVFL